MISTDQAIFFTVSLILLTCLINVVLLFKKSHSRTSQGFWVWGLGFLSLAYLSYGFAPAVGLPSLIVANISFLLAYIALALQLRFWKTGRSNIPRWLALACVLYVIGFELLRINYPYAARASLGQFTIWVLTIYLLALTIEQYRTTKSVQLLLLGVTFAIESFCALSRLLFLWFVQIPGPDPTHLLTEPLPMVLVRWIWIITTAITYLTVMTYVLEKTLNRTEELDSLLNEKRQLLNAISKLTRSRSASDTASALAHELAQPITTIHLASEQLKHHCSAEPNQDLTAIATLLRRESLRSTEIMKQLEQLFRAPNQPKSIVSIAAITRNVLTVLQTRLDSNQIKLTQSGNFNQHVFGEPTQLEAVLTNLISNAVKALSEQPMPRTIGLHCSLNNSICTIDVQDNGPGIDPSLHAHLGQLYFSDSQKGSGIGLWLSNLIIDTHEGTLSIHRPAQGGTVVSIDLPTKSCAKNSPRSS